MEEHCIRQFKRSKLICSIISVIIILILSTVIIYNQYCNRIVGYVEGNTLYYNDMIYTEITETDCAKIGDCLGKVEWRDAETTYSSKIYKVKSKSDWLYLSMGTDHRIYAPLDKE